MKFFEPEWKRNLPEHTRIWLNNQPLWHDKDLFYAALVGCAVGIIIGLIL